MKHKHVDMIAIYLKRAQVTDEPWIGFFSRNSEWDKNTWHPCFEEIEFSSHKEYKFECQDKYVTINGVSLLDDRVYSANDIDKHKYVYIEDLKSGCVQSYAMSACPSMYKKGLVHKTSEGAEAFAAARIAIKNNED